MKNYSAARFTRDLIAGSTAAFATIVADIIARNGMDSLVTATLIAASMLFMKRMSDESEIHSWKYYEENEDDPDRIEMRSVPKHIRVYEISGPLFFDAAVVVALEELLDSCKKKGIAPVISHANEQPYRIFEKAGFVEKVGKENFCKHVDDALRRGEELA